MQDSGQRSRSEPEARSATAATEAEASAPTASDNPVESVASPPAATGAKVLSVRSVIGLLFVAATVACSVALLLVEGEGPRWSLRIATAACGLLGGWLLAWRREALRVLAAAIALLLIAACSFAIAWQALAWGAAGLGGGCLGAWSYGRKGRARIATATLVVAAFAVTASAGLLQALRGGGEWWIIIQGSLSLAVGAVCLRLARRSEPETSAAEADHDHDRRSPRARFALVGRILLLVGLALPYLALGAHILGRALG